MLRAFSCITTTGAPLPPDEFARSLRSGRGNAVLYLQMHGAAPYRDVILNACLHCVAYAPRTLMNGDRANYLFEIIQLTGDVPFYRERILADLPYTLPDNFDREQVFDLVARFAAHGDEAARSLLYATYIDSLIGAEGTLGSRTIIELDGLQGFLFVANALGKFLTAHTIDEDEVDEHPVDRLKTWVPDADLATLRAQAERDQPYVAAYIERVQAHRAERQQCRQERDAAEAMRSSFDKLESLLTAGIGQQMRWEYMQWSREASEEDLRKAAEAFLTETDPTRQIVYARLFSRIPFPFDLAKLIAMAESDNADAVHASTIALRNFRQPDIRALALRLLAKPKWGWHAGQLLIANHEDGDEKLIEAALVSRLSDEDAFHDLGHSTLNLFDTYPGPQNLPVLTLLYEHEPSAFNRGWCVELLIALDAFADWMIAECLHDGRPDTREQTREYLASRSAP